MINYWVVRTEYNQKKIFKQKSTMDSKAYIPSGQVPNVEKLLNPKYKTYKFEVKPKYYFSEIGNTVVEISHPNDYMIKRARKLVVEKLGKGYDFHQAELPYHRQYMIENDIYINVTLTSEDGEWWEIAPLTDKAIIDKLPPLKIGFYDLETDDHKGFQNPEDDSYDAKLISFALYFEGKNTFFVDPNEEKLCNDFLDAVEDIDVLVDWNGLLFDQKVLSKTMKRYKSTAKRWNWRKWAFIDFMKLFIQRNNKVSSVMYGLDTAGKAWLNIKKLRRKSKFFELFIQYITGKNKDLELYNLRDTEIMWKLEEMFHFIRLQTVICELIGLPMSDSIYISRIPDTLILRVAKSREERCIFRSKPFEYLEKAKYAGAFVQDPKEGFWFNVGAIDLVSLYNRIIQTFNISPETWNPRERLFNKRPNGIGVEVCVTLEKERNIYKKLRFEASEANDQKAYDIYDIIQYAIKIILLSVYGVFGQSNSRYFNEQIASEITLRGRNMIIGREIRFHEDNTLRPDTILDRGAQQIAEELGHTVIAGDTDSIYFWLNLHNATEQQYVDELYRINDLVNAEYKRYFTAQGIAKDFQRVEMEVQAYYSLMVLTDAKKRYFNFKRYDGDKKKWVDHVIDVKGFELIRGDSCDFTKNSQRGLFNLIRLMVKKGNFSEERLIRFMKKQKKILMSGKINDDLIYSKSTKEDLDDYATTTPHVRAAKELKAIGEWVVGEKVDYVISGVKKGNIVSSPVTSQGIPEIEKSGMKYYWERAFYNYVRPMLKTKFDIKKLDRELSGQTSLAELF